MRQIIVKCALAISLMVWLLTAFTFIAFELGVRALTPTVANVLYLFLVRGIWAFVIILIINIVFIANRYSPRDKFCGRSLLNVKITIDVLMFGLYLFRVPLLFA